jgi:hypothetical protein
MTSLQTGFHPKRIIDPERFTTQRQYASGQRPKNSRRCTTSLPHPWELIVQQMLRLGGSGPRTDIDGNGGSVARDRFRSFLMWTPAWLPARGPAIRGLSGQDGVCVRSTCRRGGVDTPTGEVHAASARSTFDVVSATNLRPINDRAEPSASA